MCIEALFMQSPVVELPVLDYNTYLNDQLNAVTV